MFSLTHNATLAQSEEANQSLNLEKNIDDSLAILQDLELGLDINVKFSGTESFEYTRAMCIFDIFGIRLLHGWLVDPQEREIYEIVRDLSYNQIVDRLIDRTAAKSSEENKSENNDLFLMQEFLDSTASQLTYFGLVELYQTMKPNELAILFRNNHFSTVFKSSLDNRLYSLVTDAGFATRPDVVWETLSTVDNNEQFCDANFHIYNESRGVDSSASSVNDKQKDQE